jgi:translation initiation factor 2B subunit (eIF-2B alpha/beta/delta family)
LPGCENRETIPAVDPFDHIRAAAADRRSGSVAVTVRAAQGLHSLSSRTDLRRAARVLLRAHPAMAPLWRLLAEVIDSDDPAGAATRFADGLRAGTTAASDAIRWTLTKRRTVVLTHSSSASVVAALERVRPRVERVVCTASLPGGEGRALARRLERMGLVAEVVPDAAVAHAAAEADLVLVGADAVTEEGVVNKLGTYPLALAAREMGVGCYAIASTEKLLPHRIWAGSDAPAFEETPLDLFDAVLTERGAQRAGAIRRAVGRVRIPATLEKLRG